MLTLFIRLSLHINLIGSCLLWSSSIIIPTRIKIVKKPSEISKKLMAEAVTTSVPTLVVEITDDVYSM